MFVENDYYGEFRGYNPAFVLRVRSKRAKEHEARARRERERQRWTIDRPMPDWVKRIVADCCRKYRFAPDTVLQARKRGEVRDCRREILYRVRTSPSQPSYPQIGRWFGMEHTSVYHAVSSFETMGREA